MKIKQLYNYLTKRTINNKPVLYTRSEDNKNIYITDSYAIFIIPKEKNLINLNKIKETDLNFIIKDYDPQKRIKVENIEVDEVNKYYGTLYKATCKNKDFYFYQERL